MTVPRPILFLDVDGPLNPWRADPERIERAGYRTLAMRPTGWEPPVPALLVRLDPRHGPLLLALGFRLVWATTWKADANTWIAPVLGLPDLPYVEWPPLGRDDGEEVHWKTRRLVEVAAGRPFAWVDDEISAHDRDWVALHHAGRALLHRVDPAVGLRPGDFGALREWAAGPAAGGGWRGG
ncbi:HAD domain-containing protein [Streptomyces sp. NPDC048644]|uniref:HAD domain-containing protein n=1 Tax=Streptomyces sp. NPDC048644 TaxID=3365582 RepID=UPI00371943A2